MKFRIFRLTLYLLGAVTITSCAFYRTIYDTKSGLYLENKLRAGEIESEPYLIDSKSCTEECFFFNATIIGFVINEFAFETITPIIYRKCMEKKGYQREK